MREFLLVSILLAYLSFGLENHGKAQQAGTVDPSFKITDPTIHDNNWIFGPVLDLKGLENGTILIAGGFSNVQGLPALGLAKLDSDGVMLPEFQGGQFNSFVSKIKLLPDNRILALGNFTIFGSHPRNRVAVLNEDGTLDMSFNMAVGPNGAVKDAFFLNNSIYLCGEFTTFNGDSVNSIIKIGMDGSLDTSFLLPTNYIFQANYFSSIGDDLLVAGRFENTETEEVEYILRLSSNGGLVSSSLNNIILTHTDETQTVSLNKIERLGQDIFVQGNFTSINGQESNRFAKINSQGVFSSQFLSSLITNDISPNTNTIQDFFILNDTLIGVSGILSGVTRAVVISNLGTRISPNIDVATPNLRAMILWNSNNVILGSSFIFTQSFTPAPNRLIEAYDLISGERQANFNPTHDIRGHVFSTAELPDGSIIIGGRFDFVGRQSRNGIFKVNSSGVIDLDWNPNISSTTFNTIIKVQVVEDALFISGFFNLIDGDSIQNFAKLSFDGTLHPDFIGNRGTNSNGWTNRPKFKIDNLQRIYLVASENQFIYNGQLQEKRIIRLLANGEVDSSFDFFGGVPISVISLRSWDVTHDNKLVLGGQFLFEEGQALAFQVDEDGSLMTDRILFRVNEDITFNLSGNFTHVATVGENIIVDRRSGTGLVEFIGRPVVFDTNFNLNVNRSLNSINSLLNLNSTWFRSFVNLPDGSIITQITPNGLIKLFPDFFRDFTFLVFSAPQNHTISHILQLQNNNILVSYLNTNNNLSTDVKRLFNSTATIVNIEEPIAKSKNPLKAFPNPASDYITVSNPELIPVLAEIYDAKGRLIKTELLQSGDHTLSLQRFSPGIYIIRTLGTETKFIVK
ncbi:MAG: T9SS type A sorting domain-containing protein [Luteibaculaceae bacterium]